jgi:hypothetical protein
MFFRKRGIPMARFKDAFMWVVVTGIGFMALLTVRDLSRAAQTPPDLSDEAVRAEQAPSQRRGAEVPMARPVLKQEGRTSEERLVAALEKPTSVEWLDFPLEECLHFLKDYHNIPIIVDKAGLSDAGIALDIPVTLHLQQLRLESVLNLLLEPLDLEWLVRDEVLQVTTRDRCEQRPEVQTYEIQFLVDGGHTPEELIAAITSCIEPQSWLRKGPNAYAGISHSGGVLVVCQTQPIQRRIAQLLGDLDEVARQQHGGQPREKSAVATIKVYSTGEQPADEVAEALQDLVEVESWQRAGGAGDVRPLQGRLVVKQTARGHRSVAKFLAQVAGVGQGGTPAAAAGLVPAGDPFGVFPNRNPAGNSPSGSTPGAK